MQSLLIVQVCQQVCQQQLQQIQQVYALERVLMTQPFVVEKECVETTSVIAHWEQQEKIVNVPMILEEHVEDQQIMNKNSEFTCLQKYVMFTFFVCFPFKKKLTFSKQTKMSHQQHIEKDATAQNLQHVCQNMRQYLEKLFVTKQNKYVPSEAALLLLKLRDAHRYVRRTRV